MAMNQNRNEQNQRHLSTHIKPIVLSELVRNGQPTFGVFVKAQNIHYFDYYRPLIPQKSFPNWRKHLKVNQCCFMQIIEL